MIGGHILSYSEDNGVVTFHVKENEGNNKCYVKAKVNSYAQQLIDEGAQIWWDSETVYLTIGDVPDMKFEKVGFSY